EFVPVYLWRIRSGQPMNAEISTPGILHRGTCGSLDRRRRIGRRGIIIIELRPFVAVPSSRTGREMQLSGAIARSAQQLQEVKVSALIDLCVVTLRAGAATDTC